MLTQADTVLPRTSPEHQGVKSSAILQFVEALESQCDEIHSVMLLRHGSVVAEGWWSPYDRDDPHMLFSLSKSFTSTAVGLAMNEGYFALDDRVTSFFPDETPATVSDHLAAMCVRHLLSMSTGHAEDTWTAMFDRPGDHWIKDFFEVPVTHAPGTYFLYNTGATYMLSAIVQKTTGMKLVDYLEPRLFAPLGITNATWAESPQGINLGGIGLSLTTEDIARFGQLYLQKGVWQGQQVIPEAWINEATTSQIANGDSPYSDWTQGYGYQFWRCRHGAYRGDGAFGQYCVVMPEQDAVLVMTGGLDVFDMQQPLDLVWEILLPAMDTQSLTDAAADHEALTAKLASLRLPPVQGRATSPVSAQVSGRVYAVDSNALGIDTISLTFHDGGCTLEVSTPLGVETISCGDGMWHRGKTSLFNHRWLSGLTPVVASGAWTAEDTLTVVVRLYETPFYHSLIFHFSGTEMMVEARVNVSLQAAETLLLTAHPV